MLKPKQLSWKDTNLALIGSELDRKIKEAAAKTEPQWTGIGETEMLRVWRIEKFIVKAWPKFKHGKFHVGDSYVILNTYKKDPSSPKLSHDLHIWIGDESTQDEYGTAAYKMVEADDYLGGAAVQHRETQGQESDLFLSYFGKKLMYLAGGVESGFHHVEPTEVEPSLYRVKGTKKALSLTQVPVRRDSMNAGDVFILHAGEKVWVWNGSESNPEERAKGMEIARTFATKTNVVVMDQGSNDSEQDAPDFWKYMPRHVSSLGIFKKSLIVQGSDHDDDKVKAYIPNLFKLPDGKTGKITKVATATDVPSGPANVPSPKIGRQKLNQNHAFLLDTGFHLYVWLGKMTSVQAKMAALTHTQTYIQKWKRPMMAVTMVKAGQEQSGFDHFFYDEPEGCKCVIL